MDVAYIYDKYLALVSVRNFRFDIFANVVCLVKFISKTSKQRKAQKAQLIEL